jgi:hypothetical protein
MCQARFRGVEASLPASNRNAVIKTVLSSTANPAALARLAVSVPA